MQPEKVYVFDTTFARWRAGGRNAARTTREVQHRTATVAVKGRYYRGGIPKLVARRLHRGGKHRSRDPGRYHLRSLRAVPDDIHACGKALAKARRPRIHTGIGASDIHIMGKFRDDKYGRTLAEKRVTILKMAAEAVKLAKSYADDVEFYAEDAGRSEQAYLFEMLEAAVDAGATVLNIPDTTGYTVPEQYGALIRDIRAKVRNAERVTISVHCHDDLGLAVANALAGIQNGARQVEATINGIGERAGNASLEEIVMAIRTRAD